MVRFPAGQTTVPQSINGRLNTKNGVGVAPVRSVVQPGPPPLYPPPVGGARNVQGRPVQGTVGTVRSARCRSRHRRHQTAGMVIMGGSKDHSAHLTEKKVTAMCHPLPGHCSVGRQWLRLGDQCPDPDPRVKIAPPHTVTKLAPTVCLVCWQVHRMALSWW